MFQLLGALDAVTGENRVELGSPKQRIVLAVLLVEATRPVSADVLIDRVWDEAPAGDARRMVSTYVSRLRRALTGLPVELARRPGGYELRVEPNLVDLHRFRRLTTAAENEHHPPAKRANLLREALHLWRGTALSDLPGEWAERTRRSLHQHRLDATVAWARLELTLGHPKRVIGTIRDLTTDDPPIEPLVAVLMRALAMDGRTAEALDHFATTRRRLADELGAEPGPELRAAHESLLRNQDRGATRPAGKLRTGTNNADQAQHPAPTNLPATKPSTEPNARPQRSSHPPLPTNLPSRPGTTPGHTASGTRPPAEPSAVPQRGLRSRPRPEQLPADLADFVGRGGEVARLATVFGQATAGTRLVAISGPPGVGKTALAVRVGHQLAARFPDGRLYAALGGSSAQPADPADVLAQFLRALGVDEVALPAGAAARGSLFRARLAGRRVLLVLDDAAGHRQVENLLPAGETAVVVTSRARLTGLPGVTAIDLHPLPYPAALELLCRVVGTARVLAEPAAAAELVSACGGLPLAVRIVAARLAARPHWTIAALLRRLSGECLRLDELRHGDLAVRPALQVARQGLTPVAARAFALLGRLDVPSFPEWPVAAMLGVGAAAGTSALEELLDARFVDEAGPDRYRFHEIARAYARERHAVDIGPAEWVDALARVGAGWLTMARDRDLLAALVPACVEAGLATLAHGLRSAL